MNTTIRWKPSRDQPVDDRPRAAAGPEDDRLARHLLLADELVEGDLEARHVRVVADEPLAFPGDRVDRAGRVRLLGQAVDHRDDPLLVRDRDVRAQEVVAAQLGDRVGELDRRPVPELVRGVDAERSKAACCIAPDSEWATGWPMRTTRFVMLAPLRGRRRSRDRRSPPTRAGRWSSALATRPAIANVIARPVVVEAVGRRAARARRPWISEVVAVDLDRAPSARRPATIPAIRSDSLWRSSPAPRIVVVPRAWRPRGTGPGSRRSPRPRRRGDRSMARSADDRTTRSASRLADARPSRPSPALLDVGAHRAQEVDDRPARRVHADVAQRQLGVGMDRRRRRARTPPPTRRPGPVSSIAAPPPSFHRPPTAAVRRPVRSTGTPRARSIRSVWSRVATASRTVVRPRPRAPPAGSPTSPAPSAPASCSRSP